MIRTSIPAVLGLLLSVIACTANGQTQLGYIDDLGAFRDKLAALDARYVMEMKTVTHTSDSASAPSEPITQTVTFERDGDRTRLRMAELTQIRDGALALFVDEAQETLIVREDTSAIGSSGVAAAAGVAEEMSAYGILASETAALREYRFTPGGLGGIVSFTARYDKERQFFPYTRVEFAAGDAGNGSVPHAVEVFTSFRENPPRPAIALADYLEPVRGDTLRPVAALGEYTVLSMRPDTARPYILSSSL